MTSGGDSTPFRVNPERLRRDSMLLGCIEEWFQVADTEDEIRQLAAAGTYAMRHESWRPRDAFEWYDVNEIIDDALERGCIEGPPGWAIRYGLGDALPAFTLYLWLNYKSDRYNYDVSTVMETDLDAWAGELAGVPAVEDVVARAVDLANDCWRRAQAALPPQ
jgi:hypothetical protein